MGLIVNNHGNASWKFKCSLDNNIPIKSLIDIQIKADSMILYNMDLMAYFSLVESALISGSRI